MYAKGGKVKKMAEGDLVDDSPEDAVSLVKKNLAGQAGVKPEKSASDQSQFSVKPLAVALNPDAKSVFTKTRISGKRQLDKDSDIQAYLDADLSKNPNQSLQGKIPNAGVTYTKRFKGGGEVWSKPRPSSLGAPKKLSSKQKAKAKAKAKAAGRPYPNLIDNMRAAKNG